MVICPSLFNVVLRPPRRELQSPVLGQAQGGVAGLFSLMAAASRAFCSLYSRIFRWRL